MRISHHMASTHVERESPAGGACSSASPPHTGRFKKRRILTEAEVSGLECLCEILLIVIVYMGSKERMKKRKGAGSRYHVNILRDDMSILMIHGYGFHFFKWL